MDMIQKRNINLNTGSCLSLQDWRKHIRCVPKSNSC